MKKKLIELKLKLQQKRVNHLYKKQGLTNKVLEKQVKINQQRNKHNITDKTKRVYQRFVQ